jgi:hypothetical protein
VTVVLNCPASMGSVYSPVPQKRNSGKYVP